MRNLVTYVCGLLLMAPVGWTLLTAPRYVAMSESWWYPLHALAWCFSVAWLMTHAFKPRPTPRTDG